MKEAKDVNLNRFGFEIHLWLFIVINKILPYLLALCIKGFFKEFVNSFKRSASPMLQVSTGGPMSGLPNMIYKSIFTIF